MDQKDDEGAEAYARRVAVEKLGTDSDSILSGDGRIPAFTAGLKAHLRKTEDGSHVAYIRVVDEGRGIIYRHVEWTELDAAIDAFAAEFQAGKR